MTGVRPAGPTRGRGWPWDAMPGGRSMFPYPLGVLTVLQGLYALLLIVIVLDVGSPTLDLRDVSQWTGAQALPISAALTVITFTVGVAMHTLSRNLFRRTKDLWDMEVLTSPAVRQRFGDLGECRPSGGPTLEEVHAAEGFDQIRKAGEFNHAVDYVLQVRTPRLHQAIQVYRDQYRMARGFILPSLGLAIVLPFWEPVPTGHVGQFPLIGLQLFFLCVLFAGVATYAFRERAYRYAAARLRSFVTLQAEARQLEPAGQHLQAVS